MMSPVHHADGDGYKQSGRWVLTAKQAPHRPRIDRTAGLRAGTGSRNSIADRRRRDHVVVNFAEVSEISFFRLRNGVPASARTGSLIGSCALVGVLRGRTRHRASRITNGGSRASAPKCKAAAA